jgi:DNA-binding LytR/AlgR family response regulator
MHANEEASIFYNTELMQKYFFIKNNGKHVKVNFFEIAYAEGCRNYIKIVTDKKSYLVLITMKRIEQLLPSNMFRRIHKSFIVSLDRVLEFDSERVYLKDKELPIGQVYKGELEKSVMIVNDTTEEQGKEGSVYKVPLIKNPIKKNTIFESV